MPKGIKGIQKGQVFTEEHRRRLSLAKIGKKLTKEQCEAISERLKKNPPMKGKKHTKEAIEKIRAAKKGIKRPYQQGEKSIFWKGGVTPINKIIRQSVEYRLWREAVFKRDNWTCVWCGKRGGTIEPDHIKPFSLFPELRFAIDNGRTLCHECHKKTDTYGHRSRLKKNNN